ncbi:MAG: DUF3822 family protein [Saprospiraceae bacterium]|nr:DUF3822 family protein [Saprospiraceae bacterium]
MHKTNQNSEDKVIGLLTEESSNLARTDIPLTVEPISLYRKAPSMIPSTFVSISAKFAELLNGVSIQDYVPVYPNEKVEFNTIKQGGKELGYVVKREHAEFQSGIHFMKLCKKISTYYGTLYNQNFNENAIHFLVLISNHAIFFRCDDSQNDFFHIYKYSESVELLYHVNKKYIDNQSNYKKDRIIILGEVKPKKEVYNLFQTYFKNILTDDYNPLKFAEAL